MLLMAADGKYLSRKNYLMLPGIESESVAVNGEMVANLLGRLHVCHHWLHLHAHHPPSLPIHTQQR